MATAAWLAAGVRQRRACSLIRVDRRATWPSDRRFAARGLTGRCAAAWFGCSTARIEQTGLRHAAQSESCDHGGQRLDPVHNAASPSLGTMSFTDRRWCQGGEQAVFRTPKRSWKPPATRVAIFLADPCSHRPGRGDKVQNAPQTLIPYQLRNYGATQRRLQVDASQSEMAGLGL